MNRGKVFVIEEADLMSENVVSTFGLPLGLGLNFMINGRGYPDTINPGQILNVNNYNAQYQPTTISVTKGDIILLRINNLNVTSFETRNRVLEIDTSEGIRFSAARLVLCTNAFTRPGRRSAYSTPVQPPMDWQMMRISPRPSSSTKAARSAA
jgi:hypothetical protein